MPQPKWNLKQIQDGLQKEIHPIEENIKMPLEISSLILPNPERMAIYKNAHSVRLQEVMAEIYETIRSLCSCSEFSDLSAAYFKKYPSVNPNINWIGKNFSSFLEQQSIKKKFPFFPELAQLEWSVIESFHEPFLKPLSIEKMTHLTEEEWGKLKLVRQPSIRLMISSWPIAALWQQRRHLEVDLLPEMAEGVYPCLVYQEEYSVYAVPISFGQFQLLNWLNGEHTLDEVCEKLADVPGIQEDDFQNWFTQLAAKGFLLNPL